MRFHEKINKNSCWGLLLTQCVLQLFAIYTLFHCSPWATRGSVIIWRRLYYIYKMMVIVQPTSFKALMCLAFLTRTWLFFLFFCFFFGNVIIIENSNNIIETMLLKVFLFPNKFTCQNTEASNCDNIYWHMFNKCYLSTTTTLHPLSTSSLKLTQTSG